MAAGLRLLEQLPQKDRAAFKAVHKLYDDRKYGRAAKGMDALMKKHPECIEFLSMKALILRNIPERKAEGLASVKQALKLNIRSATAWHVLGSFHKMESNFAEALKSYKQAVKCDPTDLHLLRDLSFLQLFLRMFDDFLHTRRCILNISGDTKANWFALPFALHLSNRPTEAAEELLKWWSLRPEVIGTVAPIVDSELRLYLVRLMEESQQFERALYHCEAALETGLVKTESALLIKKGRLELRLGKVEQARVTYWRLLQLLPENMDYVFGHFLASDVSARLLSLPWEERSTIPIAIYPDILTNCGVPSSDWTTPPLVSLLEPHQQLLSLDEWGFRQTAGGRILATNVGDTWRTIYSLRDLYITSEQEDALVEYCDDLLKRLGLKTCESIEYFPLAFIRSELNFKKLLHRNLKKKIAAVSASTFKTIEVFVETPGDRHSWTLEVIATLQHEFENASASVLPQVLCQALMCYRDLYFSDVTHRQQGLARLEQLRLDVPTFIELGTMLRDALQQEGRFGEAAEIARGLVLQDEADRYLNDLCVQSLFLAGRIQEGLDLAKVFSKQSESSKALAESEAKIDMQHMDFELALAAGYEQLGAWTRAAARYHYALRRYQLMREESVDFYFYCLRRAALSSMVDYIHLVNQMERHSYFSRAAEKLIDLYFRKHDGLLPETPALKLPAVSLEPVLDASYNFDHVEKPLEEIKDIFAKLKYGDAMENVPLLQRRYLLHSREECLDVEEMIDSLILLWKLTGRRLHHPSLVPYLLHFLCTVDQRNGSEERSIAVLQMMGVPEAAITESEDYARREIKALLENPYAAVQAEGRNAQFLLRTSKWLRRGNPTFDGGAESFWTRDADISYVEGRDRETSEVGDDGDAPRLRDEDASNNPRDRDIAHFEDISPRGNKNLVSHPEFNVADLYRARRKIQTLLLDERSLRQRSAADNDWTPLQLSNRHSE